jgi:hypothetical protein
VRRGPGAPGRGGEPRARLAPLTHYRHPGLAAEAAAKQTARILRTRRVPLILCRPPQPESSCAASSDMWAGGLVAIS